MDGLEVTWINGVRRLRPPSMEKCYRELLKAVEELGPAGLRVRVDEIGGLPLPALRGIVNRYIIYSLKHLRRAPGLYHALDHANAHILRLLPPGSVRLVTVHDTIKLESPRRRLGDLPCKLCGKPGILAADWVIADSGAARDDLVEVTGYPRERIRVIPVGIDHSIFRPAAPPGRAERPYLLYVGSEEPRKNLGGLLRVLGRLRGEGIRLLKAGGPGGGGNRRKTVREARRLGVEGSVDFAGHVGEKELAGLYRGALALVMPSRREGFGMPVVEAMACGCPVVCSDIPPFREIAGEAALRFAPDDSGGMAGAVRRLASDEAFRAARVELGLERAAAFSWERCAREHLELYREAASGE